MKEVKISAREKIIDAATELLKQHKDLNKITVRDITDKSGVGVGLINYHFQTKEKLIDLCILRIISQFIEEMKRLYSTLQMTALEKLRYVLKYKCASVAANFGISKISMLIDLNSGVIGDHSDQAAGEHLKMLKQVYGDYKDDQELFILLNTLLSSIQVAFLRHEVFKYHSGIDLFEDTQRDRFIDLLIDNVIGRASLG